MDKAEYNKKAKELFFSDRDKFLPKDELGPKSLAAFMFSFLAGVVGIGLVFLGHYSEIKLLKIIGFFVAILSILICFVAFLYRIYFTIKKVVEHRKKGTDLS